MTSIFNTISVGGSVDLADAVGGFSHLTIHLDDWKYTAIEVEGELYFYTRLALGLVSAPGIFSGLTAEVVETVQRLMDKVLSPEARAFIINKAYVDGFIYCVRTLEDALRLKHTP